MSRLECLQADGHVQLEDRITPAAVSWQCSCGWGHTERRSQNALARKSRLVGAWNDHIRKAEGAAP